MDSAQGIITIDSSIRNTHYGCFVLLHEYVHFKQSKQAKYKAFFNVPYDVPKHKRERWLDLMEKIEIETDQRAQKLLMRKWGLWHSATDTITHREKWRKAWEKHYWAEFDGLPHPEKYVSKLVCKSP